MHKSRQKETVFTGKEDAYDIAYEVGIVSVEDKKTNDTSTLTMDSKVTGLTEGNVRKKRMRITWIYINYKESLKATLMGVIGTIFAFFSLLILVAELSNPITTGDEAPIVIGVLIFLVAGGGWMVWYAPKCAKKDMEKRIVKDLNYAKYIVQTYPQLIERVMELRPEGKEEVERWALETLPEKEISKGKVLALLIFFIVMFIFIYLYEM